MSEEFILKWKSTERDKLREREREEETLRELITREEDTVGQRMLFRLQVFSFKLIMFNNLWQQGAKNLDKEVT